MPARVIVGVGGSGSDPRIARTAVSLARDTGGVLYAVDVRSDRAVEPRSGQPAMQDAYRAVAQVRDAADDLDVRIVVTSGEPGATLLRLADQPHDLLVVGNSRRGRNTDRGGGVAARCAAQARCSVVLVPIDGPEAAEPGSWGLSGPTARPGGAPTTRSRWGAVVHGGSGAQEARGGHRTPTVSPVAPRSSARCAKRGGRPVPGPRGRPRRRSSSGSEQSFPPPGARPRHLAQNGSLFDFPGPRSALSMRGTERTVLGMDCSYDDVLGGVNGRTVQVFDRMRAGTTHSLNGSAHPMNVRDADLDIVQEWGEQSFPASDPPANW